MPYSVRFRPVASRPAEPWAKVDRSGHVVSRHRSKRKAKAAIRAYYANRNEAFTFNIRNLLRLDPTRTSMLRKRFMAELAKAFGNLKKALQEFMVQLDALGLDIKDYVPFQKLLTGNVGPREYAFRTSGQKLAAFNDWFQQQVDAHILSPDPGTPHGQPWTTEFVQSAYKRGLLNAYLSSKEGKLFDAAGIGAQTSEQFLQSSFGAPETLSKVQLLGTRAFEGMKGLTSTMKSQMNIILAQGIADGSGARDIASEMTDAIDGLTDTRAMTIARTEIINAHAEGQLDAFEQLGVDELGVKAEWSTAGDDRVCPECEDMEGKVFTIEEARGMIPLHPNCRCTWIPSADSKAGKNIAEGIKAAGDLSAEGIAEADALASTMSREELEVALRAARAAFNTAKKAGVTGEELSVLEREVWRSNRALWKFKQGIKPIVPPVVPPPIVVPPEPIIVPPPPPAPVPPVVVPPEPVVVPPAPTPPLPVPVPEPIVPLPEPLPPVPPPAPLPPVKTLKEEMDALFSTPKFVEQQRAVQELYRQGKSYEARMLERTMYHQQNESVISLIEARRPGPKYLGPVFGAKNPKILQTRIEQAQQFLRRIVRAEKLEARKAFVKEYEGRAFYRRAAKTMFIDPKQDDVSVILHEYGHHLQLNKKLFQSERRFLTKRAGVNKASELRPILGRSSETGFPGDFSSKGGTEYTGRVYGASRTASGNWTWDVGEVMSTGIERLYASPAKFYKEDPEFFKWVVDNIHSTIKGT